jgi:hypothetical protein
MPEQRDADQQQLTDKDHGDVIALPEQSAEETDAAFFQRELDMEYLWKVYQMCQDELYHTARLRAMYNQLPLLLQELDQRRMNLVELADETMDKLKDRPMSKAM